MERVCVFCGSKVGHDPVYAAAAVELAEQFIARGQTLVFGGGSVGMMGVLADAVLAKRGRVIGVIPNPLATKELEHPGVADMRRVPDMHARKALMAELADAFVALPGGYGTFEELLETITWAQLGFHAKPIGLLNANGYFDPLVRLVEHAIEEGFIKPAHRELIVVERKATTLLDRMAAHVMPAVRKWLGPEEI